MRIRKNEILYFFIILILSFAYNFIFTKIFNVQNFLPFYYFHSFFSTSVIFLSTYLLASNIKHNKF